MRGKLIVKTALVRIVAALVIFFGGMFVVGVLVAIAYVISQALAWALVFIGAFALVIAAIVALNGGFDRLLRLR